MDVKINAIIPNPQDATSFFRAMGPFGALRKQAAIEFKEIKELDWCTLKFTDILFLQRPFLKEHVGAIKLAKSFGVPVWVDYDDNLLNVPRENPCYEQYSQCIQEIATALEMADVVTVSTDTLKKELSNFSDKIRVIPNAFDDFLFDFEEPKDPKKVIVWRGSKTHENDLYTVASDIIALSHSNEMADWKWAFIGYAPQFIISQMAKNSSYFFPLSHIDEYYRLIRSLNPSIFIVPLAENVFNRCKSNIAYLEASYAGAVTIAPAMSEFMCPGVLPYGPGAFLEHIQTAVASKENMALDVKLAREHIAKNLMLSHINLQRIEVIKGLIG